MFELYAVDPGKLSGVAIFHRGFLVEARLIEMSYLGDAPLMKEFEAVIEFPRVYPRSKTDPNDLLSVAAIAGAFAAGAGDYTFISPATWKGNVPPEVMLARIIKRLEPSERKVIEGLDAFEAKLNEKLAQKKPIYAKLHNVIDAVGIGLWKLGRL